MGHFCKILMLQIIAPEQDKYIKRTPDGTPMEVALTQDLDHPNIVRTLRHASFQSQVNLLLSSSSYTSDASHIYIAQMEVDEQCDVTMVCTFVSLHAVFVYGWSYVIGMGANGILTGCLRQLCVLHW